MPEDFFFVGFQKIATPSEIDWQLCLAADISNDNLDVLTLEFITKSLNSDRYDALTSFMRNLKPAPLSTINS